MIVRFCETCQELTEHYEDDDMHEPDGYGKFFLCCTKCDSWYKPKETL